MRTSFTALKMPTGACVYATPVIRLIISLNTISSIIGNAPPIAPLSLHYRLNEPVPLQIRNGTTKLMKELGYGKDYQLAHFAPDKLTTMQTMPPSLQGHTYYEPTTQGNEARIKKRLEQIKAWHRMHDSNND